MKGEKLYDIEIGRYALRTFRLDGLPPERIRSVVMNCDWTDGTQEATCHAQTSPLGGKHTAPHRYCQCGIWGSHSLQWLQDQYPTQSAKIVAVIACEGATLVGYYGLRTTAARVVAFWCAPYAETLARETFTDAVLYRDVRAMLMAYDLAVATPVYVAETNRLRRAFDVITDAWRTVRWLIAETP